MQMGPLTKEWRGKNRLERFLEKVERTPYGCWEWRGAIDRNGYGESSAGYRNENGHPQPTRAHKILIGPARGLHGHHRCGNVRCVRPDHIELLTASQHGRFHGELLKCIHGDLRRNARGECMECQRLRGRRRRQDPAYREQEKQWRRQRRERLRTV